MTQWLNLPSRGDWTPIELDRYGDPAQVPPESPTPQAQLLSDADDGTGVVLQNWDRTKKSVVGCAARPLVPTVLQVLTSMRVRIRVFDVLGKDPGEPDPAVYLLVKTVFGDTIGELSATITGAGDYDMGTLSGLSIVGNDVNLLVGEITGYAPGVPEFAMTVLLSELLFDYTEDPAPSPRGPGVEIESEPNEVTIHGPGDVVIDAQGTNEVTIHDPGAVEIDSGGANEIDFH